MRIGAAREYGMHRTATQTRTCTHTFIFNHIIWDPPRVGMASLHGKSKASLTKEIGIEAANMVGVFTRGRTITLMAYGTGTRSIVLESTLWVITVS